MMNMRVLRLGRLVTSTSNISGSNLFYKNTLQFRQFCTAQNEKRSGLSPKEYYDLMLSQGKLKKDSHQQQIITHIDQLYRNCKEFSQFVPKEGPKTPEKPSFFSQVICR